VPEGHHEAVTALNVPGWLSLRDVIVPQAIPRVVPALGNYLVSMLKDTPLLSAVPVLEMLGLATIIGAAPFGIWCRSAWSEACS
jgi:polar amino acid transport system permease protein